MGSGYFGELKNLGNDLRSSSSSSGGGTISRKSKKSNSDKPKQPQRGLGVAQLEKIRLHSQMGPSSTSYLNPSIHHNPYSPNLTQEDMKLQTGCYSSSSSFSYSTPSSTSYDFPGQQNIVMGLSDLERGNIRYGDSQSANSTRWPPGNPFLDGQQFTQPRMTRQLLDLQAAGEDSFEKRRRNDGSESLGSSSHNSESSGHQDLDLELKLSL